MKNYGPAWIEVDLDVIRQNVVSCQSFLKTKLLAVVKADGYGHGAIEVAKIMEEEAVDYLGVATIFEALELRKHNIKMPILVFGITPKSFLSEAIENGITLTVTDLASAQNIERLGRELKKRPKVHLKINTGMNRLGFPANNIQEMVCLCKMDLNVEGIYTHLALADTPDEKPTLDQAQLFSKVLEALEAKGIHFSIRHLANSAAMMRNDAYHLDMVRAGGILYGHFCLGHFMKVPPFEVNRALSIKAVLSHINDVEQGQGVSYGWLYHAPSKKRIGVLPIGYTDGIDRRNTNQTSFILNGKRVDQVGLICMDQMMIDVTDVPCEVGDVVTLLGDEISLEERAGDAGIGKSELFAGIGRRLPKVYFVKGTYKKVVNYLLQ